MHQAINSERSTHRAARPPPGAEFDPAGPSPPLEATAACAARCSARSWVYDPPSQADARTSGRASDPALLTDHGVLAPASTLRSRIGPLPPPRPLRSKGFADAAGDPRFSWTPEGQPPTRPAAKGPLGSPIPLGPAPSLHALMAQLRRTRKARLSRFGVGPARPVEPPTQFGLPGERLRASLGSGAKWFAWPPPAQLITYEGKEWTAARAF